MTIEYTLKTGFFDTLKDTEKLDPNKAGFATFSEKKNPTFAEGPPVKAVCTDIGLVVNAHGKPAIRSVFVVTEGKCAKQDRDVAGESFVAEWLLGTEQDEDARTRSSMEQAVKYLRILGFSIPEGTPEEQAEALFLQLENPKQTGVLASKVVLARIEATSHAGGQQRLALYGGLAEVPMLRPTEPTLGRAAVLAAIKASRNPLPFQGKAGTPANSAPPIPAAQIPSGNVFAPPSQKDPNAKGILDPNFLG